MESIVSSNISIKNRDLLCGECLTIKKFESREVKYITFIFIIACYILIRIA